MDKNFEPKPGPGQYKTFSQFNDNIKKSKGSSLYFKNYGKNTIDENPAPNQYQKISLFENNIKK